MRKVNVIWSNEAIEDLRKIFAITLELTQSRQGAIAVKRDILDRTKSIVFVSQHQTDEFLGEPYRRILVRQYRVVYIEKSKNEIQILMVFNNRHNPRRLTKHKEK